MLDLLIDSSQYCDLRVVSFMKRPLFVCGDRRSAGGSASYWGGGCSISCSVAAVMSFFGGCFILLRPSGGRRFVEALRASVERRQEAVVHDLAHSPEFHRVLDSIYSP